MTKTEHYQLNQWDAADRVLREDFNSDNQKIDAALAEILAAIPEPEIAIGSYTGTNDKNEQTHVFLGFQPSAVLITAALTSIGTNSALILPDAGIVHGSQPLAKITENGFVVGTVIYSGTTLTPHLNADQLYGYVAFR